MRARRRNEFSHGWRKYETARTFRICDLAAEPGSGHCYRTGTQAKTETGGTSMKAMITLTVPEGKRLIAKAVVQMPAVERALQRGKILLKGGTTVSAIAEELVGIQLYISGRISPRGLMASKTIGDPPHRIVIEGGQWRKVGDDLLEVVSHLGHEDVYILGANIIDAFGGAALMGGDPLGGYPGKAMTGFMVEGVPVVVAAGLEKLIPGTVEQAVRAAGRRGVDLSMGMAVGLMPIYGKVVTEVEAVKLLAPVECQVIGRGGVGGAEGGVTLVVWGEKTDVEGIFALVLKLRGATTSGVTESFVECEGAGPRCQGHFACIYRSPKLVEHLLGK